MRTIVHISDLHFGRHDVEVVESLAQLIAKVAPNLVVASGDFTQRARASEFAAAREFLQKLSAPVIAVPGNHDVPLYDVASRFFKPLDRYLKFITSDLQPSFLDEEMAVVGINTARSMTFKNGRINERQISRCCECLSTAAPSAVRMVVTHHPFDLPTIDAPHTVVGRAAMAMSGLAACKVDLILSGHLHIRHTGTSTERYRADDRSVLLVQAGTATSTRQRGEFNSCNVLHIDGSRLRIEWLAWDPSPRQFSVKEVNHFVKTSKGFVEAVGELGKHDG